MEASSLRARRFWLCSLAVVWLCGPLELSGGDWPQILGPERNGIAVEESIPDQIPADGLSLVWEHPVGSGFAGAAVAGTDCIVFHRRGEQEVVECLHAATGQSQWKQTFDCGYRSAISSDDGPRCVPLISGKRVIVFGANGGLRCLARENGEVMWQVETHDKWDVPDGYFGAGSSPIVVGDLVIVNVGAARDAAGVVAFKLDSGEVVWEKTDNLASYSSPVLTRVGQQDCVIVVARYNTVGLDPKTGDELFSIRFGARGPTVNGASPVVVDQHLLLTASYRIGAVWGKLDAEGFQQVWQSDEIVSSQYATPIVLNGVIFGVHGRQDSGTASIVCFDPGTRKIHWSHEGLDYGTLIAADGRLLYLSCMGELMAFRASTTAYTQLWRTRIQSPTPSGYRLPALSNGRLFVRDNEKLRCVSLSGK